MEQAQSMAAPVLVPDRATVGSGPNGCFECNGKGGDRNYRDGGQGLIYVHEEVIMNDFLTREEYPRVFAELKQLDAEPSREFNERKYEIIDALAEAHFYEAIPYFVAGLENPDPGYRRACIRALVTHWQYPLC